MACFQLSIIPRRWKAAGASSRLFDERVGMLALLACNPFLWRGPYFSEQDRLSMNVYCRLLLHCTDGCFLYSYGRLCPTSSTPQAAESCSRAAGPLSTSFTTTAAPCEYLVAVLRPPAVYISGAAAAVAAAFGFSSKSTRSTDLVFFHEGTIPIIFLDVFFYEQLQAQSYRPKKKAETFSEIPERLVLIS